jgi:hypothetical protein
MTEQIWQKRSVHYVCSMSQSCLCAAETSSKPKVTPLMQFLHDKHSLKPDKKAPILVPVKKVNTVTCLIFCSIYLS